MRKASVFATAHTIIDATALGDMLVNEYALDEGTTCELLHRGMNDFYLLRSRDKMLVAQVWRPMTRTDEAVANEMEFLDHLFNGGIKVPRPHKTVNGKWTFSIVGPEGSRQTSLFDFVFGQVFSADPQPVVSRKMGEIFARIHNLSRSFAGEKRGRRVDRANNINSLMPAVDALVGHRPNDLTFYREVGVALVSAYEQAALEPSLPIGMTHGDFHIHNAFVLNNDVTIMDFDACGIDFFIQELMSYRWSIEKNNLTELLWEEFLSGYSNIRSLSAEEIDYIPIFLVGKEFGYLCGFSQAVNAIGHVSFHFPGLDWFAESLRRHVKSAALL